MHTSLYFFLVINEYNFVFICLLLGHLFSHLLLLDCQCRSVSAGREMLPELNQALVVYGDSARPSSHRE